MTDAHPYTHSTGKLKLKGVKDSKIDKKHSKSKKTKTKTKTKTEVDGGEAQHDNSVMLKKLEDEDWAMARENTKVQEGGGDTKGEEDADADAPADAEDDELLPERRKTEAEKRYDEQRRKRVRRCRTALDRWTQSTCD